MPLPASTSEATRSVHRFTKVSVFQGKAFQYLSPPLNDDFSYRIQTRVFDLHGGMKLTRKHVSLNKMLPQHALEIFSVTQIANTSAQTLLDHNLTTSTISTAKCKPSLASFSLPYTFYDDQSALHAGNYRLRPLVYDDKKG